jgi:micrococcal nuclease
VVDIRDLVSPPSRARSRQRYRRPVTRPWGFSTGEVRLVVLAGVAIGLVVARVDRVWPGSAETPDLRAAGVVRSFGQCHSGGGTNCVVDGDTFWVDGSKVRVADIDAPETHPPRCAEEARLGNAATDRLQALLNAGPVTLVSIDRDTDRYGRKLRVVERGGVSLGETLVNEGLARPWEGHRRPWC